jgi:integrase
MDPEESTRSRRTPTRSYFATRDATPHTTNNIRRLLRDVMDEAGIENVAHHRFRRTVATAVNEALGVRLSSELLGHADPRITMQHYIQRTKL